MRNRLLPNVLTITDRRVVWLDQLVFSGTSFLTTLVVARALGATAFGQFSSVMLILFLLLGINQALITNPFQVLHARQSNPGAYVRQVLGLQFVFSSMLLCLAGLGLFLFASQAGYLITQNWLLLLFLTAGFLWQDFLRKALLLLQLPKMALLIDVLSGMAQLAGLFLLQYRHALSLTATWWIMAVTYIPSVGWGLWQLLAHTRSRYANEVFWKQHWLEGKWLLVSAILQWWSGNMIIAAAGLVMGVEALGAFRLAQTIFGVFNIGLQVFDNHAVPRATSLLVQSERSCIHYLRRLQKQNLQWSVPVLLLLFVLAEPLLVIVGGASYAAYGYAVQGLSFLYLLIFMGYPIRIAIRSLLMNRAFFQAYAFSFLFTLLLAPYLIRYWQLHGVIAALLLNQLLVYGFWHWCLQRKAFYLWKSFT